MGGIKRRDDRLRRVGAAGLLLLAGLACRAPEPTPVPAPDGIWLSDGYGDFLEIESGRMRTFEVTAVSCLPGDELSLTSPEVDGSWRLMQGEEIQGSLALESESTLRVQPTGAVSYRTYRRVTQAPPVCEVPLPDTALSTYDVFWTTYAEHYPLFDLKGIDWDSVREETRARVTDTTPPEELFDILAEMIAPLQDAHTNLFAEPIERRFNGIRPDPQLPSVSSAMEGIALAEARFERALAIVETEYLVGEMKSFCKGHLRFGTLPGELFYVRLDQEGDYTDEPGFQAQFDVFEDALDSIFAAAGDARGLVLDVRKNYGGSDILSLALASRLAHEEYFAYAKVARLDADDPDQRTPPQERMVPVSGRPSFRGPVVQLIGPYTISAGETLTQALMGREPRIVRVGENTQGVFSDVLGRRLPNGWRFGLPNELFLTRDGEFFDGPGIPPDFEVPVFRVADLEDGRDPALERAIGLLSESR